MTDKIVGNVAVLDNGTIWRLPNCTGDLIWRCSWAPETITKEDLLILSSYIENYCYMVTEMSQQKRNETCSKINRLIGND